LHSKEAAWIESAELQRRLVAGDSLVIVDVREGEGFTAPPGHLPGAVNIPLAELANRMPDFATQNRQIIVVCKTDRRSARAATELLAAGLRNVAVLRGGTDGWHQRGFGLD